MKNRKFILSMSCLLISSTTLAQGGAKWSVNGNSISSGDFIGTNNSEGLILKTNAIEHMRIDHVGNIGIGNVAPSAKLDVTGTFRLDDGTQQAGYFLGTDATGNASWQALPAPPLTFWNLNSAGNGIRFEGGRVGIGNDNTGDAMVQITNNLGGNKFSLAIGNGILGTPRNNSILFTEPNPGDGSNMIRWMDGSGGYIGGIAGNTAGMVVTSPVGSITFNAGSTTSALAQKMVWESDGTTGSLGINNPAPAANLDVIGNFKLQDGTEGLGYVLTSDAIGNASWQALPALKGTITNPYSELYVEDYLKVGDNSINMGTAGTPTENEFFTTAGSLIINSNGTTLSSGVTSEGQNTIINPNGGRVAIGRSSAQQQLHLGGNLLIDDSGLLMFGGTSGPSLGVNNGQWIMYYDEANAGLELFKPASSTAGFTDHVLFITDEARLGIGTDTPGDLFQVGNNEHKLVAGSAIGADLDFGTMYLGFNAARQSGSWSTSTDGAHNGGAIIFSDINGGLSFANIPSESSGTANQTGIPDVTVRDNTNLYIDKSGYVGIGSRTPRSKLDISAHSNTDYVLTVENLGGSGKGVKIVGGSGCGAATEHPLLKVSSYSGGCELDLFMVEGKTGITRAREILVDAAAWPDYVFDEGYELRPLQEIETYIAENNHLPGVPTEKEILEEGINLGEMDVILMEKIEELTLHMIQLKKENEELKLEVRQLLNEEK